MRRRLRPTMVPTPLPNHRAPHCRSPWIPPRAPAWAVAVELRMREAAADARLAVACVRLAEALADLERARAAEL
jgi:hypothetical protein